MASPAPGARATAIELFGDARVWTVSALLVVLYVANWHDLLVPPADLLAVPSLGVMFLYLSATKLGLLCKWLGAMPGFWVGYAAVTVVVTALATAMIDRIRATTGIDRERRAENG